jgi:hypothetical protein
MRRAALVLTLLLSTLPLPAQEKPSCPPGQSSREEDPATGVVIQKTRLTPRPDRFDPLLIWTSDEPDSLMLAVIGNSAAPKYASCHRMALFADDRPVLLGTAEYRAESGASRAVEYVTADITWTGAARLGSAKTIRYRICNDELWADDAFVCQAREVIEAAEAWRKGKAAKAP